MLKKSLIVLFISFIYIKNVQGQEKLTEEELDQIIGAQMGLIGAGIDGQMKDVFSNAGISPEGCFDIEQNLHTYGTQIIFQDIEFKCFKVQDRESNVGVFQSIELLRFVRDSCQGENIHKDCTDINDSLMQQLFEQL